MLTSSFVTKNKPLLISAAIFLLVLLFVWIFIALTRIGITPDYAYWNEAGVPLLAVQILAALLVSVGLG